MATHSFGWSVNSGLTNIPTPFTIEHISETVSPTESIVNHSLAIFAELVPIYDVPPPVIIGDIRDTIAFNEALFAIIRGAPKTLYISDERFFGGNKFTKLPDRIYPWTKPDLIVVSGTSSFATADGGLYGYGALDYTGTYDGIAYTDTDYFATAYGGTY